MFRFLSLFETLNWCWARNKIIVEEYKREKEMKNKHDKEVNVKCERQKVRWSCIKIRTFYGCCKKTKL